MTKKEQFAKFIRILSVPPIMITTLVLILAVFRQQFFHSTFEILMIIFTLGIFPVLAYPLQKILPKYRHQGREGQRNLALILNLAGYTAALILCPYFCWSYATSSFISGQAAMRAAPRDRSFSRSALSDRLHGYPAFYWRY